MVSVGQAVFRLKRVPPRRIVGLVGRYAVRTARAQARRWHIQRNRGELSDAQLQRALRGVAPEVAFDRFLQRFFVQPARARDIAAALERCDPARTQRTLTRAEDALNHVVDLLGSGPVPLGPRIDWQRDFKTGLSWRADLLPTDQDGLRLDEPCDIKVPWELSRCHHWATLGRAYALNGDSRYALEFVAQLRAWLDDNPWPFGVNWDRAMEVAVRAVNWMWAAALFADAPEFAHPDRVRLLKSLLQHGRYIAANLEYAGTNGNHYLSNGVGLLYLGLLFSDFTEAEAWRRKGEEIVWGEMPIQVYADGVDFEQGIGYQGLVTEFWYSSVLLADRLNLPVPPQARERLERMCEFMLSYTRPDGTFPQIGDNDDGRLAHLDEEPVGSHCRHLAVGGALFGRPDLLAGAQGALETAAWLCGPEVLSMPADAAPLASRAFAEGGFYVMRSTDAVTVVDAGDVGMRGIGGHGHADVLSFDLWAAGAPLLVDSGTGVYSADPVLRQVLRATRSHNVLTVDGQDSSRLSGGRWLWLIENDAHPHVTTWQSDAQCDVFEASHDGYARLPEPVVHTRRMTFRKGQPGPSWRIDDSLTGRGSHLIELFFHPAVAFDLNDNAARLCAPDADAWLLLPDGMTVREESGWISRGYGLFEPAPVLVCSLTAGVPLTLRTDLVLVPRGTPLEAARSLVERT
jgi:hypothetical protein